MAAPGVPDILARIVARRRERLGVEGAGAGETGGTLRGSETGGTLRGAGDDIRETGGTFVDALAGRRGAAIVAEVKMGSPRLGSLAGRVDPERQARIYRERGAAALSVVVEPDFFHGSYELLTACKGASGLPALAKDFVVSHRQLDWARDAGADAILLIAALYAPGELRAWAEAARALGLVPLIETHTSADVGKLAGTEWELVGVNNRDLRTFEVDLEQSIALRPALPAGALAVAESGISGGADRRRLAAAGFDAFLIGEALLLADDPGARLEELLSE